MIIGQGGRVGQRASRALRWDCPERAVVLDLPSGAVGSSASAINRSGTIVGGVGWSTSDVTVTRAVTWDRAGDITMLDSLFGDWSGGTNINDSGAVCGVARDIGSEATRAVLWYR